MCRHFHPLSYLFLKTTQLAGGETGALRGPRGPTAGKAGSWANPESVVSASGSQPLPYTTQGWKLLTSSSSSSFKWLTNNRVLLWDYQRHTWRNTEQLSARQPELHWDQDFLQEKQPDQRTPVPWGELCACGQEASCAGWTGSCRSCAGNSCGLDRWAGAESHCIA